MPPPISLETERLILRPVREDDAPAWTKHFVDYEVIRHLARRVPWPYPDAGVLAFLRTEVLPKQGADHWTWAILLKDNPEELIGVIELWRIPNPANRGFWLGRKFWGQGIMTEAAAAVTDYAFDHLNFDRLYFDNAKGNLASRRIKEKTGARLVRIEPAEFVDPAYTERELWELTKEAWRAVSARSSAR